MYNFNDNRGTISEEGNVLRVDNALVESIYTTHKDTGFLNVSYAIPEPNHMTQIELLTLNVDRSTTILNSSGLPIRLCDIRKGMWIDSLFSSRVTRSIPPQSSAFLIMAREKPQSSISFTRDRVAMVDIKNNFLYTGDPNNINSQMRFTISDNTAIVDNNQNPINLDSFRPGEMVLVAHANFQTASIPPQSPAFYIQQS